MPSDWTAIELGPEYNAHLAALVKTRDLRAVDMSAIIGMNRDDLRDFLLGRRTMTRGRYLKMRSGIERLTRILEAEEAARVARALAEDVE